MDNYGGTGVSINGCIVFALVEDIAISKMDDWN